MAVPHINYDKSKARGAALQNILLQLQNALDHLAYEFGVLDKMKTTGTDGTQATHWPYATTQYGFNDGANPPVASDAKTLEAYNELNSLKTVISAAITQASQKLA